MTDAPPISVTSTSRVAVPGTNVAATGTRTVHWLPVATALAAPIATPPCRSAPEHPTRSKEPVANAVTDERAGPTNVVASVETTGRGLVKQCTPLALFSSASTASTHRQTWRSRSRNRTSTPVRRPIRRFPPGGSIPHSERTAARFGACVPSMSTPHVRHRRKQSGTRGRAR